MAVLGDEGDMEGKEDPRRMEDMEKAYDSVCRKKFWETLEIRGVEEETVSRVKETSCVKMGERRTE